jgi:hypothetical protein
MGRRSRRWCAVLACAAFFAAAGLAPRTAAADDWADPPQSVQTSSSTSTSAAQNDNETIQRASPTQTGGSEQTQSTIQIAPTQQSANATSRSNQSAANHAGARAANQENKSSSSAVSRNSNETKQSSVQDQESAPPPDPAPSQTQSQSSSQSAPTTQHADASATSNQVAPTNINISVRIDSPGDNGPVNQTNSSTANAVSNNANTSGQDLKQTQGGGRPAGEQSQSAAQSAPTNQVANATSSSKQVAPTNLNITVRNKSPGDEGPVTQTNDSGSSADAGNANASNQSAGQVQEGAEASSPRILGGNGTPRTYVPRGHTSYPPAPTPQPTPAGVTQSQTSMQSAPTTQSSNASATSVQQAPTNDDVSVTVDKGARDPNGSGRPGTLIQIWIPEKEGWPAKAVPSRTNSSSADATAVNSNKTTQSADQRQTAPSGGATQVGGGSQTQTVRQGAPTTQNAAANAASQASGSAAETNMSLGKAIVDNSNQTTQNAMQIQEGGLAGGSQVQIVEQTAPTVQSAIAQSLSVLTGATNPGTDGWSLQTDISSAVVTAGKSNEISQGAEQVQVGTSETQSQVQVVEQSVASAARTRARQVCRQRCVSTGSTLFTLEHQLNVWSSSTGKDSSRSRESGASKKTKERAPRDGQLPRGPELPGAAAGASSGGGGGTLWIFAALLIPFALTASWWARHYGPSAFRRLAGVVVRPERPG